MRILHVSTRLILGGSQENTILSCEGQARLGHDVHLAFGPIYGPEGSLLDRVRAFNAANIGRAAITTHVIPHLVRPVDPWKDLCALGELREVINRVRPDVVHTHSSKAGVLGRAAAWSARDRRRPPAGDAGGGRERYRCAVVHTIHGPPFMPIEGSPLRRLGVRLTNALFAQSERYAARRTHVLVSVADAMTREFLGRRIGRPDQFITIRSGMETDRFLVAASGESGQDARRSLGLTPSDFIVGTVARLAQHKGHDDLLGALGEDLRANPSWKLLWVGDGWWKERLLARARAMGLCTSEPGATDAHAQVIVTGMVAPERVPALIRAMDVLAHPSYREGLPRTVPQALLCGVCPVAYDADGTGEVCRELETGRLVKPGDLARLRDVIVWCANRPAERAALASRGRDECREVFSAERMVERLDTVYRRALAAAGLSRPPIHSP